MQKLIDQFRRYLFETLDVAVTPAPWEGESLLPLFLRTRYRFFEVRLLRLPCLLMADQGDRGESPASIRKHIEQVQARWDGPVVYVRECVPAYNRKRMIEQKAPFVVPGNQMYLPMLGVELRERFRKPRPARASFRPSTQVVLIHALLRDTDNLSLTELASKFGYSVMTMSRALDELEAAGLSESSLTGRERRLLFGKSKHQVWKKAQPFLRDPVKRRHTIRMPRRGKLPGPLAGLSALAQVSMLAEPLNVVVALSHKDWKALQKRSGVIEIPEDEPGGWSIEVWSYAPLLLACDGRVDRLSLYLSLREDGDERIETALDQMMEDVEW